MRFSPLFLILSASIAALGIGQVLVPIAQAQPLQGLPVQRIAAPSANLRVRVESLHTKRIPGGLEVTGQVVNTGRQALIYTSVVAVFTDAAGRQIGQGDGYLAAGPLRPGQPTEFRALVPEMPAFTGVNLILHEAGHPVTVETASLSAFDSQRLK